MQTTQQAIIGRNVALLHSHVSGNTLVDIGLLIEDDNYLSLITKGLESNTPLEQLADALVDYVNNNY